MNPTLPGFEVLEKLGGGAVSDVYRVRATATQQQQVLKLLRPELLSDADIVGRFLDEAKICQSLDHPNIVKHLGVSRTPTGGYYIVTRYVQGEDLAHYLKENGPLTADRWLGLAHPLLDALTHIHQRGIVHRDLKPSNILLAGGIDAGRPMLIDFGVARFEGHRVATQAGLVLTTPEYTAPELIDGQRPDVRTDLYAFGITMFESLVGHPPFTDSEPTRLLEMHRDAAPGPLPTGAAALEPVVQRCLAKKPADRFQSAHEVKAALREAAGLLGTTHISAPNGVAPLPLTTPAYGLAVGNVLGNYKVERLLGEGGMGQVFLGTHVRLGRQVAIKILRPEHAGRRDVVARFFQEARSVNQINHEHIVDVHDFVEDTGPDGEQRAYCIMELLAGKTVREVLDEGPLPLGRTLRVVRQITDSLIAAHRLGIVHRDIKPENIFLTQRSGVQDFVKVLDFGMAKFLQSVGELNEARTLQGVIIGTPAYMAPEQINGKATDARTDVYALGVVLYELLTSKTPFDAPAVMPLFMKICGEPAPALGATTAAGEPIPPALASLVARCLEKQPATRPQTMVEVSEILASLSPATLTPPGGLPAAPPSPVPPRVASQELLARAFGKRKPWVPIGIAAAVVILAGGAVALVRGRPAEAPPPQPVAVVAAPAPAPRHMKLTLTSSPSGAEVRRVDSGEILGTTPLVRELPAVTGSEVPLRFALPRYKVADRTVALAGDVSLDVALSPDEAEVPAKARPARGKRRSTKDDLVDPLAP
jgi:serine/threonine protein kinase